MKSAEEAISSDSIRKPIKKRVIDDDSARDDDDYDDYHASRSSSSGIFSPGGEATGSESSIHETKARKELYDFLESKGIDATRELSGYRVLVQHSKNRRLPPGTFSVTYSGPDGDILSSKSDVLTAIKRNIAQSSRLSICRSDVSASAKRKFEHFREESTLPLYIDEIKVISFGTINYENSTFHSSIEIHPIGYKAEIIIPAAPAVRSNTNTQTKSSKVS